MHWYVMFEADCNFAPVDGSLRRLFTLQGEYGYKDLWTIIKRYLTEVDDFNVDEIVLELHEGQIEVSDYTTFQVMTPKSSTNFVLMRLERMGWHSVRPNIQLPSNFGEGLTQKETTGFVLNHPIQGQSGKSTLVSTLAKFVPTETERMFTYWDETGRIISNEEE